MRCRDRDAFLRDRLNAVERALDSVLRLRDGVFSRHNVLRHRHAASIIELAEL
jgi:hypothetical protein